MLKAGDANGDNAVDTSDFGLLVGAYGSSIKVPGSGYDPAEDFNCDGSVDTTDFGLLVGNYGGIGIMYPITLQVDIGTNNAQAVLSWSIPNSTSGTVYNVYRSVNTSAHGVAPYHTQTGTTSFTDSNLQTGTYYYQVSAILPNNGGCGLSQEAGIQVITHNKGFAPTIAGTNPYFLVGYQQSGTYAGQPSYQATVTDGLLTSFLNYNGANAAELFHTTAGKPKPDGVLLAYTQYTIQAPEHLPAKQTLPIQPIRCSRALVSKQTRTLLPTTQVEPILTFNRS